MTTQASAQKIFLIATGETHNGQETYTRHDALPPYCEAETLYQGDERLSAAIYLLEALSAHAPAPVALPAPVAQSVAGDHLVYVLRLLLAKIRRDAPELSGRLMGYAEQAIAQYESAPVAPPETKAWVDKVMEQAQVFASSWSLVGGRFDDGTQHEQALQEKEALRAMLAAAPQRAPVVPPDSVTSTLLEVVPGPDGMGVEVYAKTAADVRLKLTEMSLRIEELESNAASAPVAQPTDAQIKRCLNDHFLSSGAATSGEMVLRFARAVLALKGGAL